MFIAFLFTITNWVPRLFEKDHALVIYDDNRITAINFATSRYNYIITPDTTTYQDNKIKRTADNFSLRYAMPNAKFVCDSVQEKGLKIALPYIVFNNEKILILNSEKFCDKRSTSRLYIHKAIICRGFKGSIPQLLSLFNFKEIIIASDVNRFKRAAIIKECEALSIPYYDIKRNGAYIW